MYFILCQPLFIIYVNIYSITLYKASLFPPPPPPPFVPLSFPLSPSVMAGHT